MLYVRVWLCAAVALMASGSEDVGCRGATCASRAADEAALLQVKTDLHLQSGDKGYHAKARRRNQKVRKHRRSRQLTQQVVVDKKRVDGKVVTYLAEHTGKTERQSPDKVTDPEHNLTEILTGWCQATLALDGCQDPAVKEGAETLLSLIAKGHTGEELETDSKSQVTVDMVEACALSVQSAETAVANSQAETAHDLAEATGIVGEDTDDGGYQGDMMPSSDDQLLLFQQLVKSGKNVAAGTPWTDGHVKYCYASDVPANIKNLFEVSTQQFVKALPCLSFEDVGHEAGDSYSPAGQQKCNGNGPAIFVMASEDAGCYSYVGQLTWASQQLQLHPTGCASLGTAMHELGHALGMAHEQARPDRDEFVQIHWDNIPEDKAHNFEVNPNGYSDNAYEYESLMHYDAFAFALDHSLPTITKASTGGHEGLGQRSGLATFDVEQMQAMYVEVNPSCAANAIAGVGCVDLPDASGVNFCRSIVECGGTAVHDCCACGGGLEVQCYAGSYCPERPAPLPPGPTADCVETAMFGAQCGYANNCNYDVEFTCAGQTCNFGIAADSGFWVTSCGGEPMTALCEDPGSCQIWSNQPPPTTTPIPTTPPPAATTTTWNGPVWNVTRGPCTVDSNMCVTSPNFPQNYGANQTCTIEVSPNIGVISAWDFQTEEGYDKLKINGEPHSGTDGPVGVTPTAPITWSSDSSVQGAGWKLCQGANPPTTTPATTTPPTTTSTTAAPTTTTVTTKNAFWQVEGPCSVAADGCVTSPNYPLNYEPNQGCNIGVPPGQSVKATPDFQVEIGYDTLTINQVVYNGRGGVIPNGPITWSSDYSVEAHGWKLCPDS